MSASASLSAKKCFRGASASFRARRKTSFSDQDLMSFCVAHLQLIYREKQTAAHLLGSWLRYTAQATWTQRPCRFSKQGLCTCARTTISVQQQTSHLLNWHARCLQSDVGKSSKTHIHGSFRCSTATTRQVVEWNTAPVAHPAGHSLFFGTQPQLRQPNVTALLHAACMADCAFE